MATVSVRLQKGIHAAVKELAEHVGVDNSEMATFLLCVGISYARFEFSERTMALIGADALEAQAAMLRAYADTRGTKKGAKDWKDLEGMMNRLTQVAQLPAGEQG